MEEKHTKDKEGKVVPIDTPRKAEDIRAEYKQKKSIEPIKSISAISYVAAVSTTADVPVVWIQGTRWEINHSTKWTIVGGASILMNKEDGVFETVNNREHAMENSFDTPEEAFECFKKFYE
jgi:hypothetical protein